MAKKKEKELKPKIEKHEASLKPEDFKEIAKDLEKSTITETVKKDSHDSYFRSVLDKLFDNKDVSSKTEYLNVSENFAGSKLEFFASFGNMPYLKKFINIFEIKRISLERKGRKEILLGLQERRQEIEQQRMENLRGMFNV